MTTNTYFNQTQLKSRGWTAGAIQRFLGDPDLCSRNPHNASHPIKRYAQSRVEAVEASDAFIAWQQSSHDKRTRQSEHSKHAHEQSRQTLIAYIDSLDITLPDLTEAELKRRAFAHYEQMWARRGKFDKVVDHNSDTATQTRVIVNYLRHGCTSYEAQLEELFGKTGKADAYALLKAKINAAIVVRYPFLSSY